MNNKIETIKSLIANGSTFARIETLTAVKTAAKFKHIPIMKHSVANVTLFGTLNDYSVYSRMVLKSSNKIDGQTVNDFVVSDSYFEHDKDCFSIVYHKSNQTAYLYAVYNNVSSTVYTIDGIESDKITVAEYLTPSEKEKMLGDNSLVYNKTNNVLHDVIVRTIKIDNILSIKCNKTELALNGGYTTALHA
jgi:hypothetical protein